MLPNGAELFPNIYYLFLLPSHIITLCVLAGYICHHCWSLITLMEFVPPMSLYRIIYEFSPPSSSGLFSNFSGVHLGDLSDPETFDYLQHAQARQGGQQAATSRFLLVHSSHTSLFLFLISVFDYLIPPMGMDKCNANSVDNDNVHKAGMVMNGLPISVYASETLGCAAAMSTDG
ncbi:hypothetical protein ZEAMMB73_Zm00001d011791 [Zea mays]|uniref:Uncharacterized protein n=1 Tax=Zea mays TaxID=4577 RepID=A0A1D6G3W6_MAIZE|nr:hypothetical protein ZEAMMB73_Zm00001d011791 [Zea mays]